MERTIKSAPAGDANQTVANFRSFRQSVALIIQENYDDVRESIMQNIASKGDAEPTVRYFFFFDFF